MSYHRWLTKWPPVTVGRAWLELSHRTPRTGSWWAKLALLKFGKINVPKKRLLLSYWLICHMYIGTWFLSKDLPEKKQFPQKISTSSKLVCFLLLGKMSFLTCRMKTLDLFGPPGHTNSLGVWAPWRSGGLHVAMSSLMVQSQIPRMVDDSRCKNALQFAIQNKVKQGKIKHSKFCSQICHLLSWDQCKIRLPQTRCPSNHPGSWHCQTQRYSYNEFTVSREFIWIAYNL